MKIVTSFIFIWCGMITLLCGIPLSGYGQILPGAEKMNEYLPMIGNRRVAVVANPASTVGSRNLVDTLVARKVHIRAIFSPEHGFRSWEEAGREFRDRIDTLTGIRVISLYGKKKKPSPDDLNGIDLVLFDLQDVGVRFYTYISTLSLMMEACAENRIPMILLDRPNPNGFYIDGPVLIPEFRSFVGMHPVPVVYGMTIGEYARMVNGEGWLEGGTTCDLTVIPLTGYNHWNMPALPVKPSPNLPTQNSIHLYPSLCFFEGTSVSVGRGTRTPFEIFGHPAFKGFSFAFTPESIIGMSENPPFRGELCRGLDLSSFYQSHPKLLGRINLNWLLMAFKNLGSDPELFNDYFDKLAGSDLLRRQIIEEKTEQEIRLTWQEDIEKFKKIREKYLLYP